MPILTKEASAFRMPRLFRARQEFEATKIDDVAGAVRSQILNCPATNRIRPGQNIAIAVGSRGIRNIDLIVKTLVDCVIERGAHPFIVPSMGSHGGATAAGQEQVLAGYGITAGAMGVPVKSSMEVVAIGSTEEGIPVYFDAIAFQSDGVIPVARIKPHTDFRGIVESGLCKMLTIGLGKHVGCSRLHKEGFDRFAKIIPEAAAVVLAKAPILFGLAMVENAYDETTRIEAVPANEFLSKEPQLLELAKRNMPRILVDELDVLILDEIGKDVSGAGMDPNITGRTTKGALEGFHGPLIKRIVICDISNASHGNAIGVGLADFVLSKLVEKVDSEATFANAIASGNPEAARIPIHFDTIDEAVAAALSCSRGASLDAPRIVRAKNTLHLSELWVSEAIARDKSRDPRLIIEED